MRLLPCSKYVHEPWTAPPATLAGAGVQLGLTYPQRITMQDLQVCAWVCVHTGVGVSMCACVQSACVWMCVSMTTDVGRA
jgi:hypothetical protein